MATPPAVGRKAEAELSRFWAKRAPVDHHDRYRLEYRLRGNAVTIRERRPPFPGSGGAQRTRVLVEQLGVIDPNRLRSCVL